MPVSGTIHELNSTLSETPSLINKSPFDQGNAVTYLSYLSI